MNLLPNSWQQMGKKSENGKKRPHPQTPATAPRRKFLSLLRYQLLIDVNEMRVKNITVTVSVRVSVTVRVSLVLFVCITVSVRVSAMVLVSLVWFVISNNVGGIKFRHLPNIAGTIAKWL